LEIKVKNAIAIFTIVAVVLFGVFGICQTVQNGLGGVVDVIDSNGGQGNVPEVDLYKKAEPKPVHPLKKEFPELFTTEAVVVAFGADWCGWCKAQARDLKGPSFRYNILYVKVDKDGKPTRWGKLADKLELGKSVPVTVVIEKGKVTKTFIGFTPWGEIKPHAQKAKKNDQDDEKNHIDIGPIHIDWDDDGVDINRHRRNRRRR
jgi:thiol-disulfide isomerase/thioredoxin